MRRAGGELVLIAMIVTVLDGEGAGASAAKEEGQASPETDQASRGAPPTPMSQEGGTGGSRRPARRTYQQLGARPQPSFSTWNRHEVPVCGSHGTRSRPGAKRARAGPACPATYRRWRSAMAALPGRAIRYKRAGGGRQAVAREGQQARR